MVQTAKVFQVTEILIDKNKAFIVDHILFCIGILVKRQQLAVIIQVF